MGKGRTGNVHLDSQAGGFLNHVQGIQLIGVGQDALGQTKAQGKIGQVGWRAHHDRMADAVVNQGHRGFLDHLIGAGGTGLAGPDRGDVNGAAHLPAAAAFRACCRRSFSLNACCQSLGWVTFSTCTAVTLYSGQLVAQSLASVVITLAPLNGW